MFRVITVYLYNIGEMEDIKITKMTTILTQKRGRVINHDNVSIVYIIILIDTKVAREDGHKFPLDTHNANLSCKNNIIDYNSNITSCIRIF